MVRNPCATCYQSHSGNGISKPENLWEISRNPSPISRFPSPKIRFSSYEIRFTKIGFLLSSKAFRFLQRLSAFSNSFLIFLNGFPLSEKPNKIYLRRQRLSKLRNHHSLPKLRNRHSLPELRNCHYACISPNKTNLRKKCFGDTGGVYIHHLWLSNKPSSSNLAQNLVGKKVALPG